MSEKRVFVPQHPTILNGGGRMLSGNLNSVFDAFGRPIWILPFGKIRAAKSEDIMNQIEAALFDFNPDTDSVLATGDPIALAAVVMVASMLSCGRLRLIRWAPYNETYQPFDMVIS